LRTGAGVFERTGKALCLAGCHPAVVAVVGKCGQARTYGNDCDDHQDFDQRESAIEPRAQRLGAGRRKTPASS
jgi:hypothetical protein